MRRAGASAIVLALCAVSVAAQSSISLTALDRQTVATLGSLVVNGNGFDPANAAISVVVAPRGGVAVSVPAYFANAVALKIVVPPLVETATSRLFDVPVVAEVQVVQVSATAVVTSNVLGGLTIEPAPSTSAPPGALTKAWLLLTRDVQGILRAALAANPRFARVVDRSRALDAEWQAMIDVATAIAGDPGRTMTLATTNGDPFVVTSDALRVSDRIAYAIAKEVSAELSAVAGAAAAAPAAVTCPPTTGDPQADQMFCSLHGYYDPLATRGPAMIQTGAALAYGMPLSVLGGQAAAGIGAAGIVSEATATGLGLAMGPVTSHVSAYATGAALPSAGSTFTDLGLSILDNFTFLGLPITSGINAAVQLAAEYEQAANAPNGPSATVPRQGVVVAAPPQRVPANTRPVIAYQGLGISSTARWLAAAGTQQILPILSVTLPPPEIARFNGLYSGSVNGSCSSPGEATVATPGAVSMTVSSGTIAITSGGTGSGTVTASGQVSSGAAAVAGATCRWGGRFWADDAGRAGALGSWSCSITGATCSGTWNVKKQ
ncbi:MAG: hypothetical protein A3J29_13520 [Acidobacteria bacterium RIFCSPLOWO2_12_FULL_67_14b]|nr:MAG: hypothetical protein A3J29_13520 [Acidobacteria bacterium RIFCSPLOWO2_12_FULL_67_14b]